MEDKANDLIKEVGVMLVAILALSPFLVLSFYYIALAMGIKL